MSEDALQRAERINTLLTKWRDRARGRSKTPLDILNLLEENPYCTVNQASEKLNIAFATAQRGIDKLIALGILEQTTSAKRNRVYCARKIMDILEEPAVV